MIYDILTKQAQVILSLDSLADAKPLDMQIAKQAEGNKQVRACMEQKRILHERFLLQEISIEDYKSQKAGIDVEVKRLRQMQSVISAQIMQMQMDKKQKTPGRNWRRIFLQLLV